MRRGEGADTTRNIPNIFSGDDKDKGQGLKCLGLFPVLLLAGRGQILGPREPLPTPSPISLWRGRTPLSVLTLQLEMMPSPPAQIMLVFTELPHQSGREHVA